MRSVLDLFIAIALLAASALFFPALVAAAPGAVPCINDDEAPSGVYRISVPTLSEFKFAVDAHILIDGTDLSMGTSRPGDIQDIGDKGWPEVIRNLKVTDENGRDVPITRNGDAGWKLTSPRHTTLHLKYTVDLTPLASANWPAPREAAFADSSHFIFVGRSTFITNSEMRCSTVEFSLPTGWHAVAPWHPSGRNSFSVTRPEDLVENLIVLTTEKTEVIKAGSFTVSVTPLGHWQSTRRSVAEVIRGVIPKYVKLFGAKTSEEYSVILLPVLDQGGEAYRGSFAYTYERAPTEVNRIDWGHIIAHEIFHYWNGYRLVGADYPSSQWFQEGFTDYMSDLAMRSAGLIDEQQFLGRIDSQLDRYSRLTTPLARPGTHKGPPLYGGGALVALLWDIQIRKATLGKKSLQDLWPVLWRRAGGGTKPYTWEDIRASLTELTAIDWDTFYLRYVDASESLPLGETLRLAGLTITTASDGTRHVQKDPTVNASTAKLRRQLLDAR